MSSAVKTDLLSLNLNMLSYGRVLYSHTGAVRWKIAQPYRRYISCEGLFRSKSHEKCRLLEALLLASWRSAVHLPNYSEQIGEGYPVRNVLCGIRIPDIRWAYLTHVVPIYLRFL